MTDSPIPTNTNHRPHSTPARRVLTLTSYSRRRGPLIPAPTPGLAFDLRALPNPPKRLRDVCVGTDKALRAAFMADETCRLRVNDVQRAVKEALGRFGEAGEAEQEAHAQAQVQSEEEAEEELELEERDEQEEQEQEPLVHIRVGVCCEMGRHRSVACVEELARAAWPPGWVIEVVHRDLKKHRSERDKEKRSRKVEREMLDESD